jgi:hypothetical protein
MEKPHTSGIARHSASKPSFPRCALRAVDFISSYTVFEGLSYGGSRFIYPLEHQNGGSLPAFSVRVGYIKTFIRVHAKALAQFLEEVGLHLSPQYECDIVQILKFFSAIQAHFMDSKDRYEPQARREIKLFVVDLLLDEAIFSSVDEVQANQFWSTIRRSIRSHKAIIDLDSLRRALELPSSSGLTSDVTAKEVDHTDHHSPWISINGEGGNVDPRSLQLIKFRAYFYKGFSTLEQHQTSVNDLSRLQIPANRRNAWRLGFRVVRNLLRGQLPQDVRQVIFCVMMAHAMREGAECYKFTQEEYVSTIQAFQRLTEQDSLAISVDGETHWTAMKIATCSSALVLFFSMSNFLLIFRIATKIISPTFKKSSRTCYRIWGSTNPSLTGIPGLRYQSFKRAMRK